MLNKCRYLITGAASGIGYYTAKTLCRYGAKVLLLDINATALENVAHELGENASFIIYDLSSIEDNLYELIKSNVNEHGPINGFVHCAGIPYISPVSQIKSERAHKVLDVNAFAAVELSKITTKKSIRAKDNCSSVLISSVYGLVGSAANAAYAMSKGAIISLTKALAVEYAPKKYRFNCIAPGFVKTPMLENGCSSFDDNYVASLESLHPLGLGSSQDISESIAFLLSHRAKWITGAVLPVDGGFTAI